MLKGILSLGTAVLFLVPVAIADVVDPALFEDGSGCLTSGQFKFCVTSGPKADPIGGMTTLAYQFDNTVISSVTAGDILINEFGTSTVGDVVRFENIGGSPYAFIYSNDKAGGLPADVGLPASFQANNVTITEDSTGAASLAPTAGQPGFESSNSLFNFYHLDSPDTAAVPEPTSIFFLTVAGALIGTMIRRRRLQ